LREAMESADETILRGAVQHAEHFSSGRPGWSGGLLEEARQFLARMLDDRRRAEEVQEIAEERRVLREAMLSEDYSVLRDAVRRAEGPFGSHLAPWRSDRFGGLLEEALQRLADLRAERDAGYRASAFSQLQQAVDSDDYAALDGVVQAARFYGPSGPLLQQAEGMLTQERAQAAAALQEARRLSGVWRPRSGFREIGRDRDDLAELCSAALRADTVHVEVDEEVGAVLRAAGYRDDWAFESAEDAAANQRLFAPRLPWESEAEDAYLDGLSEDMGELEMGRRAVE